jgi:outer membrane protein OmpA-like peptidoglycan-associated protein
MLSINAKVLARVFVFVTAAVPAVEAAAQIPAEVRVVNRSQIRRWYPHIESDVLLTAEPGTRLEVLDRERAWYWVVTPRDDHGTRRTGWIQMKDVEAVARGAARPAAAAPRIDGTLPSGTAASSASLASGVTVSNGPAPAEPVTPSPSRKDYSFDDIHFALDRFVVRDEDASILDGAASALKGDPLLRVNIEGYTCNLGKPAHNLLLGEHRANAVKDYLLGKGVSADQLRTKSFGEDNAKYDNSTEETRKLNRRVALVPTVEP